MGRSLVPLNASRAFEAAARRLSFAEAASELHVTPAAISHHVKQLELFIGAPLFTRRHRSVELTAAGQACHGPISAAIESIEDAILNTRKAHAHGPLRIRVAACLASKWLLPRLDAFHEACPDVAIEVTVSTQVEGFRFDETDAVIRLCAGDTSGFTAEPIMEEHVVPVCSPAFLGRYGPFEGNSHLADLPLIHDDNLSAVPSFPTWTRWFSTAGMQAAREGGHRFDSSPMAIDAAIDGRGVALGRSALVADDLASGRLIRLSDFRYPMTHGYFIVYLATSAKTKRIVQFRDWLIEEGRKTADRMRADEQDVPLLQSVSHPSGPRDRPRPIAVAGDIQL